MSKLKFYICPNCGDLHAVYDNYVEDKTCANCKIEKQELIPNTTDAAVEKHLPVVEVKCKKMTVKIGSVEHPMTEEHYIQTIILEDENNGFFAVNLKPNEKPVAEFKLKGDKPVAVYAYCNLHGLWKTEIK